MIADFYCAQFFLIVEVDGGIHNTEEIKEKDAGRDEWSKELNYKVLRFTNEEVLTDIDSVLKRITTFIRAL